MLPEIDTGELGALLMKIDLAGLNPQLLFALTDMVPETNEESNSTGIEIPEFPAMVIGDGPIEDSTPDGNVHM